MGKQCIFLQLFKSGFGVVVIHRSPGDGALDGERTRRQVIVLAHGAARRLEELQGSGGSCAGGGEFPTRDFGRRAHAPASAWLGRPPLAPRTALTFSYM